MAWNRRWQRTTFAGTRRGLRSRREYRANAIIFDPSRVRQPCTPVRTLPVPTTPSSRFTLRPLTSLRYSAPSTQHSALRSSPLSAIPSIGTSLLVLTLLAIILAGSWITFQILARRAMEDRHAVALSEWGRDRGFRFRIWAADDPLPPPLNAVSKHRLRPCSPLPDRQTGHADAHRELRPPIRDTDG